MKIAVSSQNFRSVTGHAGRARRFLVFDAQPGREPVEVARLDLPRDMCMHEFRSSEPHPLDAMDVILSAGFGAGFARKMGRRGVGVAATSAIEPARAAAAYAESAIANPPGRSTSLASGGSPQARQRDQHRHRHGCGCGTSQGT